MTILRAPGSLIDVPQADQILTLIFSLTTEQTQRISELGEADYVPRGPPARTAQSFLKHVPLESAHIFFRRSSQSPITVWLHSSHTALRREVVTTFEKQIVVQANLAPLVITLIATRDAKVLPGP